MITPDRKTARTLAAKGAVVPVYATVLADTETPVSVWLKLYRQCRYGFLLESVTGGDNVARYSFIGGDPFMVFRANGSSWEVTGMREERGDCDPFSALRELMSGFTAARVDGLPRFTGGAVGFASYDTVRLWERIPDDNERVDELDELLFGFYRDLVVFDNREHRLLVVSNILPGENDDFDQAYDTAVERIRTTIERLSDRVPDRRVQVRQKGEIVSNMPREQYERAVERAKEYIKAGDIFQVVLSQRFSVEVEADPFDLYRVLRIVNPSPYMYYLACDDWSVVGASPEMLVRVEDRQVEVRPIAGTRRRGRDEHEDLALERELLADEKERAEHVMLVDLGRNDVGRVSDHGSVRVENMMHIERYSHVMHIVSDVIGRLREKHDCFDALGSCFPAGTLSGAPKIRAMEIIDELETQRRGLYGGALGYVDFGGNLDTCIVIRTILYHRGTAHVQVGAGIVADSQPAREYEETVHKASALFSAIGEAGRVIGGA
ncbi:MAG: anthranilate synthase component I [Chitinivibrionales bacterium]|nr:anthranilate synthase component I [Chitinivibrionales bacterium]